jgi:hypothetical protein
VKKRGDHDAARFSRFFDFDGPDKDTIVVLDDNLAHWLIEPQSFWIRPGSIDFAAVWTPIDIARGYVQADRDDA